MSYYFGPIGLDYF